MVDAHIATPDVVSSVVNAFVHPEVLQCAREAISRSSADHADKAERQIADLAARVELPVRASRTVQPDTKPDPSMSIRPFLVMAFIFALAFALLSIPLFRMLQRLPAGSDRDQVIAEQIEAIVARANESVAQAQQAALKEQKQQLLADIGQLFRDRPNRSSQRSLRKEEIYQVLQEIRRGQDGWELDDEKLAERLADGLSRQR